MAMSQKMVDFEVRFAVEKYKQDKQNSEGAYLLRYETELFAMYFDVFCRQKSTR
jgi:hypothetical protein